MLLIWPLLLSEAAEAKKKAAEEAAARKAEEEKNKKEQDTIEQNISRIHDQVQKITKNCNKGEGCQDKVNDLLTVANTFKSKFGGAAGKKWVVLR